MLTRLLFLASRLLISYFSLCPHTENREGKREREKEIDIISFSDEATHSPMSLGPYPCDLIYPESLLERPCLQMQSVVLGFSAATGEFVRVRDTVQSSACLEFRVNTWRQEDSCGKGNMNDH